ncbi:hypothetical protein LguiB_011865 [Lonicera macranthoides]
MGAVLVHLVAIPFRAGPPEIHRTCTEVDVGCLLFLDGLYHEVTNQPSSSSGSLARRLFDEYRQSFFIVDNGHVPGLAFKNKLPYLELNELNLLSLVSNNTQLQFYQEARIKTAIFMGCKNGEIELGLSNETQVNMEMEMKNLFPEDFSRPREPSQPHDQNRPSSSSSSLRSLSMDSPEPSPFLFNIPNTSYIQDPSIETRVVQQAMRPISTTTTTPPVQQAIEALSQIRNIQFPTIERENVEMTKAILAVLSSSSPSSTSSSQPQPQKASAFKSYRSVLGPMPQITRKQNMLKRAIKFFAGLTLRRNQEQIQGTSTRPSTTQLHHMISERRRREKLNESFQALRSLLPQGTKRDKASVLTSTTEYLSSLKAQVEELSRRNQILEAQLPDSINQEASGTSSERVTIQITDVGESTSDAQIVDLQVRVRGEYCSMLDLVIRVMEFLKQDRNVSLMSIEAQPVMVDTNSMNRVVLRLKIEGVDWDKSAFQEAVKRVVDDLAQ